MSTQHPKAGSQQPKAGNESAKSLTKQQKQLVLGTLLGDGSMGWGATHPRYASNHGWIQHQYNLEKHQILSEYANSEPKKRKNKGFGKWLSRFQTLSSPVFDFIEDLCYTVNPFEKYATGKFKMVKTVTQKWLDAIDEVGTWEAVAWWFCDDGNLDSEHWLATFHTESFSKPEVELLAKWLYGHGVDCKVQPVTYTRDGIQRTKYTVLLNTDGTKTLIDRIKDFVPECMKYKVTLSEKFETLVCSSCGQTYFPSKRASHKTAKLRHCCGRRECELKLHRERCEKSMTPERQQLKNAQTRQRYHDTLEASRKYNREKAARLRNADPEETRRKRREYRAKQAAERAPRKVICGECQLAFETEVRAAVRYCDTCRPLVIQRTKQESAARCKKQK